MKIEFEPTAFALDEWWAGEIIMEVEEEKHTGIYPFTLFVGNSGETMEVTWTEKTPTKNIIDIETRIKQYYLAK